MSLRVVCTSLTLMFHAATPIQVSVDQTVEIASANVTTCAAVFEQCGGIDHHQQPVSKPCCAGFFCSSDCPGCDPQYYQQCIYQPPPPPSPPNPPYPPSPPPSPPKPPPPPFPPIVGGPYAGFNFLASSTAFGYAKVTSCGGIQSARTILDLTGFIPIAAAQSMMAPYKEECHYSSCKDTVSGETYGDSQCPEGCDGLADKTHCDVNNCRCTQPEGSTCLCGLGTEAKGTPGGTAPLGCFKCARGRFLKAAGVRSGSEPTSSLPFQPESMCTSTINQSFVEPLMFESSESSYAGGILDFVVVDTCPYAPQPQWCPLQDGDVNQCGMKNHFDIAMDVADLEEKYGWAGNFIEFDVIDCPGNVNEALSSQITFEPGQCDVPMS